MKRLIMMLMLEAAIVLSLPEMQPPQPDYPTETEWASNDTNWSRYVTDRSFVEYRLWDNTRVDYLSPEIAWEIDWAYKWAEAIGQSRYYSLLTNRRPGIILLVKQTERDESTNHVYRCQTVCAADGIELRIEIVSE